MVFTIADIRAEFKRRLMIAPYGLSAEELNQVLSMLLDGMNTAERRLFARFDFWMMSPELDEQIICANVELVRFGVLSAILPQKTKNSGESFRLSSNNKETKKQNWDASMHPSLAFPKDGPL